MKRWLVAMAVACSACSGSKAPPGDGGAPPPVDAGPCGADPCAAPPQGCSSTDLCQSTGTWHCGYVCGSTDGGPGGDGGLTATTVCNDIAQKACDYAIRCNADNFFFDTSDGNCTSSDIPCQWRVTPDQRAACVASVASNAGCQLYAGAWGAGRANFDPNGYASCVGALYPANSCARDLNQANALCDNLPFFQPAEPVGQLCASDRECSNGWCTVNLTEACGTCQAYLPLDGGCSRDSQCDPSSAYCPGADGTAGNCTPYSTGACNLLLDSADFEQCGPNKVCPLTGTCMTGLAQGQTCSKGTFQCARASHIYPPALLCTSIPDAGDICMPFQAPAGGTCLTAEAAIGSNPAAPICPEDQYCNAANTCVPRLPAGQDCPTGTECAIGTTCDAGICWTLEPEDAGCTQNSDCLSFLDCNFNSSTCLPDHAVLGATCDGVYVNCAGGYCAFDGGVTGVCGPPLADGQPCNVSTDCASLNCDNGDAGVLVCQPSCWK